MLSVVVLLLLQIISFGSKARVAVFVPAST